jgi:hypothetical protein
MSPLKGKRSETVYNIVRKSVQHPEIEQHDIQVLLWGIIYGVKFTDYSIDFQNRVRPLLTTEEIADLSLDLKNVPLDIMPDDIKKVAKYYQDFRNTLTNPSSTYDDIERNAMLGGLLPDDLNSKYIQKGNWAYIGNGFFARAYPEHYSTTYLELYKPPKPVFIKDTIGRVISIDSYGYKVDIVYDDEPGREILSISGKPDLPIWRFKSLKFTWNGNEKLIENKGWIIKDDGKPLNSKGSGTFTIIDGDEPTYEEYQKRLKDEKDKMKEIKEIAKAYDSKDIKIIIEECKPEFRVLEGIKFNFDENKPITPCTLPLEPSIGLTDSPVFKLFFDIMDSPCFTQIYEDPYTSINKPPLEKSVAVPATNGKQRIIISERKQK